MTTVRLKTHGALNGGERSPNYRLRVRDGKAEIDPVHAVASIFTTDGDSTHFDNLKHHRTSAQEQDINEIVGKLKAGLGNMDAEIRNEILKRINAIHKEEWSKQPAAEPIGAKTTDARYRLITPEQQAEINKAFWAKRA